MMNQQTEWLVTVSLVEVFDGMVCDEVGGISHFLLVFSVMVC